MCVVNFLRIFEHVLSFQKIYILDPMQVFPLINMNYVMARWVYLFCEEKFFKAMKYTENTVSTLYTRLQFRFFPVRCSTSFSLTRVVLLTTQSNLTRLLWSTAASAAAAPCLAAPTADAPRPHPVAYTHASTLPSHTRLRRPPDRRSPFSPSRHRVPAVSTASAIFGHRVLIVEVRVCSHSD
jgi:hypothetical protein